MEPYATPLGPDPAALAALAASPAARRAAVELDELVGDRKLVLRSDRIDLSKNIVRGFHVYDELLATHPEWRDRVVFVAMLNRSRENLAEYLAYEQEVDQAAARVNDRWGTDDWQPVVVDTRDDYEQTIAGFTRFDALLVNPVKDGLNLVAKEGPLLNRRDGVVCLSPEAGAYEELADAALAVHPYDIEQGAHALHTALAMPDDERAARATRACASSPRVHTPQSWLARAAQPGARAVASPSDVQHFRQARRTVDHDVGGRAPRQGSRRDATPMLTPWRELHRRVRARAGPRRRGGHRRRRPRTRRPHAPRRGRRPWCPCRREPAGAARPPSDRAAARRSRSGARASSADAAHRRRGRARCASGW